MTARDWARLAASLFFVGIGILHLVRPDPFLKIMPPQLPWPLQLVYISGVCEILGGIALQIPPVRRAAAWGLVALLIAIFPANVYMAVAHIQFGGWVDIPAVQWARLPFQAVFIFWVLWCTSNQRFAHRAEPDGTHSVAAPPPRRGRLGSAESSKSSNSGNRLQDG